MSSLVTNVNSSTAQEIVNWVTTADGCVHTADATQLWRCVLGLTLFAMGGLMLMVGMFERTRSALGALAVLRS